MSLLAALALALAQAAAAPEPYRAIGASPLWSAEINAEWMFFDTPGRETLMVPAPRRQEAGAGFAHRADGFTISVEPGACTDGLTGRTYADRVEVRVGDTLYTGCGGSSPGAGIPAGYGAAGGEPFWRLEIADGRLSYHIDGSVVIVPAPAPLVTGNGARRVYRTPELTVSIRRRDCELDDGVTYADTVTVTAGGRTVEGCGGAVVREAPED